MARFSPTLLLLSLLPLAACSFEPDGAAGGLADQLRRRAFLDVSTDSAVAVSAVARGGETLDVDPGVLGGQAVLRTTEDGWLLVEDLEIPLEDVVVPAGMLADRPVTFTDLAFRLGTQLSVPLLAPLDDETAALAGFGEADLLLDWAMLTWDGDHIPLAMRRIADAPFAVALSLAPDGRLHATITTRVDGEVDSLGDLVILRDLSLDVQSATPMP